MKFCNCRWILDIYSEGLLKSDPREKPLDQSAIYLIAPSQLQPRLYQNIQYLDVADWFLGDIECFKCSDWVTITIGA